MPFVMQRSRLIQIFPHFLATLSHLLHATLKNRLLSMQVVDAYRRCSSAILYRVTTVLLNARRGSEQYQSIKSRMAWS